MSGISLEIEGNPVSCRTAADDLRDLASDLELVQPMLREHAEIEDREFSGSLGDEFRQQSARNLASATTQAGQALRFASALDQLARDMERAQELMDRARALDPEGKVIVDDRVSPAFAGSNWALFQQVHSKAADARLFWLQAQNAYLEAVRANTDLDPAALDSDVPFTPVKAKSPSSIQPLTGDYVPTPEGGHDQPSGDSASADDRTPEPGPAQREPLQSTASSAATPTAAAGPPGVADLGASQHGGAASPTSSATGPGGPGGVPMQHSAMGPPDPARPPAQFLEADDSEEDAEPQSPWRAAPGWQSDAAPTEPGWQSADPELGPGPGPSESGWQAVETDPTPPPGQPPVAVSPEQASAPPGEPDHVSDHPDGDDPADDDMEDTAEIRPIIDEDFRRAHFADRLGDSAGSG